MSVQLHGTGTRDADAGPQPRTMKAAVHHHYGSYDRLELRDLPRPAIADGEVLVRVHASSLNPVEWYRVRGPVFARLGEGLLRPRKQGIGADLAGRVEAVGKDVSDFRPGDEVFGTSGASWAEYTAARAIRLARKPANVTFEEAAAAPIAGLTALQAVRDHGRIQPGQKVLINGASGGVGTYAVQLAKIFGADVTAVCSTANVETAASLGADRVIDYRREDFTRCGIRHDVMLDIAGSRPLRQLRRVLAPRATVVLVGGKMNRGLGPLPHLAATWAGALGRSETVRFFIARIEQADLELFAELLEAGKVRSVIDRRYELADVREALRYLGEGHARGKVVVTAANGR
jgi:NADPH:quinone reductase-like Zn-dependent oxidoreductase